MKNPSPKTHHLKPTRGFTLIETLVAISVLLLSVSAPLSIAARSIATAGFARDQIVAFYLAQDAIEYVRNMRDKNSLSGLPWLDGFVSTAAEPFIIDTLDGDTALCPANGCPPLEYNENTNFYSYNDLNAEPSRFTRTVSLEALDVTPHEAIMTVTISWSLGTFSRSFTVKENIFDWQ